MAVQLYTYNGEAAETVRKITDQRTEYDLNTLYYNKVFGWWWYRNSKGHFHVVKIERKRKIFTKTAGRIVWYGIYDYMLSGSNEVKFSKYYGYKDTIDEAIREVNEIYRVAENPDIYKNNT